MEKLELIKSAHIIDQHLQILSAEIADDVLKDKILAVQSEWRGIAYAISAHLSGVDASIQSPVQRKRGRRKKLEEPVGQPAQGEDQNSHVTDEEQGGV